MIYLVLIGAAGFILVRGTPPGRPSLIAIGALAATLLFMWGGYLTWDNPSGDPQGSMFRGIEQLALILVTCLVLVAIWVQYRRGRSSDTVAKPPKWIILLAPVALVAVYLILAFFN